MVKRVVPAHKGDLVVNVSVDGNLNMPQAFDLHFGAPGDVKEVLCKEGDRVKAGAILARLDDTTQRLDIKSSNNGIQNTLSNLYETVPRLPQFRTKFYDTSTPLPTTVTTVSPITTTTMWNVDVPPPPPVGPPVVTVVTTTTGRTTGNTTTITITAVTTTVTAVAGPVVGTTTVTTAVSTDVTTLTITLVEKPSYQYFWNNVTQEWNFNPAATLDYGTPNYYANSTAMLSFLGALDEINAAGGFMARDNLTAAASELYMAPADLDAVAAILEDTLNNPDSGLGNLNPAVPADVPGQVAFQINQLQNLPDGVPLIIELRKAVEAVRQSQADMDNLRSLLQQGKKEEVTMLFEAVMARMAEVGRIVFSNVNIIEKRSDTKVYGKEISLWLYKAAEKKMNAALKGIEKDGNKSPDLRNNLRIARHYMELANGIVGSNEYVLQHGLSQKSENQYKIDLESKLIDLNNKKDDFLKTVIMAPVDGIIVSVGTKVNDVLSSQDYSSKGTIQIVDTSQIKFQGLVDEIDILKIKTGMSASVSVDAVADRTFPGRVSFISPFGTADTSGVVKFNVTVLLDPTDVDLKGGLTATADIAISKVENALLVPLGAVTTTKEGSFVTVQAGEADKTEKRQVTTGAQNQQFIQVLKGLNEGDRVVIEASTSGLPVITRPQGPPGGGGPPPR
jgi:RND family efflux transporter MFP subunit